MLTIASLYSHRQLRGILFPPGSHLRLLFVELCWWWLWLMGFISHCFDWHSGRNSRSLVSILSCCEGWVFFTLKGCQDTLTTGFLKIRCVWNLFPQYTPPRHFVRASVMNRYNSPLWTEMPVNPSFSYKNCPQGGNSVQSTFSSWDKLKKSEVTQSCPSLWDPMDCSLPCRLLCPWYSPGKNIGAGCHLLLQGTFLIQGSNPGLLHCRQTLYPLSRQVKLSLPSWLSRWRICLQCRRPGFHPWVGKIPPKRERLPTPVFWPREFYRLVLGVVKSLTERLSLTL